jgi:hypothetical protein
MGKVWKEVIRPGDYWHVNAETQKPEKLTATASFIKHLHDQGMKMRQAGLSIPVPLEHDLDNRALTKAERAAVTLKNNAGWVDTYKMLSGDRLFAQLDIEDEEVYRKLPRTIKYTSPWINSFVDGDGNKWEGVISHLALTSRPRITKQEPFGPVAAALSLAAGVAVSPAASAVPSRGIYLSRAALLVNPPASPSLLLPKYPMAFSAFAGATLAEGYDKPEEKKKPPPEKGGGEKPPPEKGESPPEKGKGPPEKGEGEKPPGMDGEKPPEMEGMEQEEMGLVDVLMDVVCALWGVELPEDTDESNLLQNLMRALMDHLKNENGRGGQNMDSNKQPDQNKQQTAGAGSTSQVTQEQPPFYMSLEQVAKITDPSQKQMAEALLSLQTQVAADRKRTESLTKSALDKALLHRQQRIEGVCRRNKEPGFVQMVTEMAKTATLSMGDDGRVNDSMDMTLTVLERGMKDIPQLLMQPSSAFTVQEHPAEHGANEMTEERRKQVVAEMCKAGGLPVDERKAG